MCAKAAAATWYQVEPEKFKKVALAWGKSNTEKRQLIRKRWRIENPEKVRSNKRFSQANRRALKLQACPTWVDRSEISKIYEECPPGYHVDHDVPLNHPLVCGLHVPANLNPIPAEENLRKSNSFDPETYVHILPEDTDRERNNPSSDPPGQAADLN